MLNKNEFGKLSQEKMYEAYCLSFKDKVELKEINDKLSTALEKLDLATERISALEGEVGILKSVNKGLKNEAVFLRDELENIKHDVDDLYKRQNRDNQYGRRENIELCNIPKGIEDTVLKAKVVEMFTKVNLPITSEDISACHRLKKGETIVKFINREHAEMVMDKATTIREQNFSEILNENPKIYVNANLSPDCKRLFWILRMLKKDGKVQYYGSSRNGVYFQKVHKGRKYFIWGESDLYDIVDDDVLDKYCR